MLACGIEWYILLNIGGLIKADSKCGFQVVINNIIISLNQSGFPLIECMTLSLNRRSGEPPHPYPPPWILNLNLNPSTHQTDVVKHQTIRRPLHQGMPTAYRIRLALLKHTGCRVWSFQTSFVWGGGGVSLDSLFNF